MRVAIIGGGPAGAATAIRLKQQDELTDVIIYETKDFDPDHKHTNHNACAGVLSYPIDDILNELGVSLPDELVEREIKGYRLYTEKEDIELTSPQQHKTVAVRRVELDNRLLQHAQKLGATVVRGTVTGIDFFDDSVDVASDAHDMESVDVVVGAFGLNESSAKLFEPVGYKMPGQMQAVLTTVPGKKVADALDGFIMAYLLPIEGMEFGAMTPKEDHVVVNVAGDNVTHKELEAMLNHPKVRQHLPDDFEAAPRYKGRFPVSPAKNYYGDRYVMIGDASGLLRAFKGKGINTGMEQGILAADNILHYGVSRRDFKRYYDAQLADIRRDRKYGTVARLAVNAANKIGVMDSIVDRAKTDPIFKEALYNSVSGDQLYRQIFGTAVKKMIKRILPGT